MDELSPDAGLDAVTDSVMALLGDEDEPFDKGSGAPQAPSGDGEAAADPAPDADPASGDEETQATDAVEPGASSAIDVPDTFSAELKERFSKLDPETQRTLAQWEQDRNRGVSAKLQEAASQREALKAAQEATQSERSRLAATLTQAIELAQAFNPVIAQGLKMSPADWNQLAQTDPAGYVARKAAFDNEIAQVQGAIQQRDALLQQQRGETVQAEMGRLVEAMPELRDPKTQKLDVGKAQAFAKEVDQFLVGANFSPQEIAGLTDHRMLLVVREAIAHRKAKAARTAAAVKQVVQVPKVVRPGTGDQGTAQSKNAALLNRIGKGGSIHDDVDAITRLIESGN